MSNSLVDPSKVARLVTRTFVSQGRTALALKALWLSALRGGEYQQGKGGLRCTPTAAHEPYPGEEKAHCCLGVLQDAAAKRGVKLADKKNISGTPGNVVLDQHACELIGLPYGSVELPGGSGLAQDMLAALNDDGVPFAEIAKLIEEHL